MSNADGAQPDSSALIGPANDAAGYCRALWVAFITYMATVFILVSGTTHADLLFENPIKLPLFDIGVPLRAFYIIAPLLLILFHLNLLMKLHDLRLRVRSLTEGMNAETLRRQIVPFEFGLLAGSLITDRRDRWLNALVSNTTIHILPVVLLLFIEVRFLPYHGWMLTWFHRLLVLTDICLIAFISQAMAMTPSSTDEQMRTASRWPPFLYATALFVSVFVVAYPGEPQDYLWRRRGADTDPVGRYLFSRSLNMLGATIASTANSPLDVSSCAQSSMIIVPPDPPAPTAPDKDTPPNPQNRPLVLCGRDLSYANFTRAVFLNVEMSGETTDLRNANFEGAYLRKTHLEGAHAEEAYFDGANLRDADLSGGHFRDTRFLVADLRGASLAFADLERAILSGSRLDNANLSHAYLEGADLSSAWLRGADLGQAHFDGAKLGEAHLEGAGAFMADFSGADLHRAYLQATGFDSADLSGADFEGAELQSANFSDATLAGTILTGTKLLGAQFDAATIASADFSNADVKTDTDWKALQTSIRESVGDQSVVWANTDVIDAIVDQYAAADSKNPFTLNPPTFNSAQASSSLFEPAAISLPPAALLTNLKTFNERRNRKLAEIVCRTPVEDMEKLHTTKPEFAARAVAGTYVLDNWRITHSDACSAARSLAETVCAAPNLGPDILQILKDFIAQKCSVP